MKSTGMEFDNEDCSIEAPEYLKECFLNSCDIIPNMNYDLLLTKLGVRPIVAA
jgi:hypothetical protein